jgi:hypothetical protein
MAPFFADLPNRGGLFGVGDAGGKSVPPGKGNEGLGFYPGFRLCS